jgi:hypothetical protein
MTKITLNLNLSTDLALDTAALDFALVQHLEGTDEAGAALSGKVDSSKLALAERAANLKHSQVELPGQTGLLNQSCRSLGGVLGAFFRCAC